jgi:bifunctional non-homologous end joining protein LigD
MKRQFGTQQANLRAADIRAALARAGAPPAGVDPAAVRVMKPKTRERPFSKAGWVFELKYDGFRVLASGGEGEARLLYRSGAEATRAFPELARAVSALPFRGVILDGEAVVLDEMGRPSFQRLQRRALRTRAVDAGHAALTAPATLVAFDLLACEGFDLRPLPLADRKAFLRRVLPGEGPFLLADEIPERGEDLYAAVARMGLEGIVAKRAQSPYRAGYSDDWLKIRVDRSSDFAVVGFTPARHGFSNLHLAVADGAGGWTYAGTVGTGFTGEDFAEILAHLEPGRRKISRGPVWVEPELVVEVRYKEWTEGGHLRHPVFLRLRHDKAAGECLRPE